MSSAPNGDVDNASLPAVIELNVGGVFYTTSLSTLTREADSLLAQMFTGQNKIVRDSRGKYFLDRDGVLFRYILDYLRNNKLVLPERFQERDRLKQEAEYFQLNSLVEEISSDSGAMQVSSSGGKPGYITVGYRGSFAFGRDGLADVKFRKLSRILICGRISLCREVFGDTLNESRDPDRGYEDRYTGRYFLKHTFIEQAFDMLLEGGFRCVGACASSTSCGGDLKPGMDPEENKWNHYNEFVFVRP